MLLRAGYWFVLGACASGCYSFPHVRVSALDRTGSRREREALFAEHRRASLTQITVRYEATPMQPEQGFSFIEQMRLANGLRVFHPIDLLPITGERGAFADAARDNVRAWHNATIMHGTAVGLWVGSLALALCSVLCVDASRGPQPILLGSGITLFVGAPIVLGLSYFPNWHGQRARERAFDLYDSALRRSLDLCARDPRTDECLERDPPSAQATTPPTRW